jgi:hypothetical protein
MMASKIAYKPVGLALGAVSGLVAGAAFKQAWKVIGHDDDAPDATDQGRGWLEGDPPRRGPARSDLRRGQGRGGPRRCNRHPTADRRLARLNNVWTRTPAAKQLPGFSCPRALQLARGAAAQERGAVAPADVRLTASRAQ